MDRLRAMEVFVAVVEAGSFAAAGMRLGMSPPAVTRAVAAVEDRLGTRLLNRTTRRLSLTEAGSRYLKSARRLVAEIAAAEPDERTGLRRLYVVLTRAVSDLTVVHAQPLPHPLGV